MRHGKDPEVAARGASVLDAGNSFDHEALELILMTAKSNIGNVSDLLYGYICYAPQLTCRCWVQLRQNESRKIHTNVSTRRHPRITTSLDVMA